MRIVRRTAVPEIFLCSHVCRGVFAAMLHMYVNVDGAHRIHVDCPLLVHHPPSGHLYSNITVLFLYSRILFWICHRTARERTTFSMSRPLATRSSSVSRCEIRSMPCSITGPSSSTSVT